jgi:hypothetical protein
MNKFNFAAVIVISSICLYSFSIIADAEQLVIKAAESQLPIQLAKIPVEQQTAYGFSLKDNLEFCTIGKPYRILEFSHEFYQKELKDNVDYLVIKNEWRAPVLANTEHRTLLSVNGISGNYIVAGLGDAAMARELQRKIDGIDKKETFYILRIFPLLAEFFVHEGNQSFVEARFIPLNSAVAAIPGLNYDDNKEYSLTEVQYMVKDAIRKKNGKQKLNSKNKTKKRK